MNKYQKAFDCLFLEIQNTYLSDDVEIYDESMSHFIPSFNLIKELVDKATVVELSAMNKVEKEFVLFNKQGERIDSVDPYRMHKLIGNKVIVSNDMFEYGLSLENGNTFEIVRMEE